MNKELLKMNERFQKESEILSRVRQEIGKVIIGQEELIERLLLAIL